MITKDGFTITYSPDSHTVTVTRSVKNNFDGALARAHDILCLFRQSSPGSQWGCDGVGYEIQKRIGVVRVNKSGVGMRKFQQGIEAVKQCNSNG